MAFYSICNKCGANLDPGEHCDCEDRKEKQSEFFAQRMKVNSRTGQYSMVLDGRESQHASKIAN